MPRHALALVASSLPSSCPSFLRGSLLAALVAVASAGCSSAKPAETPGSGPPATGDASGTTAAAPAATSGQSAEGSESCATITTSIDKTWSAAIKAEVMSKGAGSAETKGKVVADMDAIAKDWVAARRSICDAHFGKKTTTIGEYVAEVKCLDARLADQAAIAASLKGGGAVAADAGAKLKSTSATVCRKAVPPGSPAASP